MGRVSGIPCPECGWRTRVWVEAAPGPSDWACVVCDLRAENHLLRESRERIARERERVVRESAQETRRLREALWFYGDPENWFAISVLGDPPCGPIYYDIDPDDDDNAMGRPTHGRLAREVLFGDDVDFEPPLDYTDWCERYGEPED